MHMCTPRVVTGEKNSPTAAHAGRKRRPKWVLVPGVTAGPPCRGGYKYGALQIGGWATDRRPVAVTRSLLLGNKSCGLEAVRLSGIDRKRISEIRIATWNGRSFTEQRQCMDW